MARAPLVSGRERRRWLWRQSRVPIRLPPKPLLGNKLQSRCRARRAPSSVQHRGESCCALRVLGPIGAFSFFMRDLTRDRNNLPSSAVAGLKVAIRDKGFSGAAGALASREPAPKTRVIHRYMTRPCIEDTLRSADDAIHSAGYAGAYRSSTSTSGTYRGSPSMSGRRAARSLAQAPVQISASLMERVTKVLLSFQAYSPRHRVRMAAARPGWSQHLVDSLLPRRHRPGIISTTLMERVTKVLLSFQAHSPRHR